MSMPNVLLVDDELSFLDIVTKRLSKKNIQVRTASSGEEALQYLENDSSIEIVILDVKMPGMDGLETLSEIKRKHNYVEVIILTGHASVESAIEGMRLGAFDYLMKPCDIDKLILKVEEAANMGTQRAR
ncbi:response regulator [Thermodesulfobacteriota bacterium]